jgi:hypothetical protein
MRYAPTRNTILKGIYSIVTGIVIAMTWSLGYIDTGGGKI